ncbi:MAG: choice-of-anchor E domain-containing protein [Verrucomicrobiia bacterium]
MLNTKRYWKKAALVVSLVFASHAAAASYSYGPVAYPEPGTGSYMDILHQAHPDYQSLDYASDVSLSFPKFNTSLGSITSVFLLFEAELAGSGGAEHTGSQSATVTFTLAANFWLRRPDNSNLIALTLSDSSWSKECTSFDGVIDFQGQSGLTVNNYTVSGAGQTTLTSPGDLALFTGSDSISLPVSAIGQSGFSGSGNLFLIVRSGARVGLTVTYTYTPVPEPSVVGLVSGLGLVGFAGWRRTRQSRKPGC